MNVWNDFVLRRTAAGRDTGESERGAQRAKELSPIQTEHLGKSRLLLLQPLPEGLAVGKLLQAAPQHGTGLSGQLGARRGKVEGLRAFSGGIRSNRVRRAVSMRYAFSRRAPSAAWSTAFQ